MWFRESPHISPFKILWTKSPYKMGSSIKGSGLLSPWGEDLHFGLFVPNPNIRLSEDIVFWPAIKSQCKKWCATFVEIAHSFNPKTQMSLFQSAHGNSSDKILFCIWVEHLSIRNGSLCGKQRRLTSPDTASLNASKTNNRPQFISYPALQKKKTRLTTWRAHPIS